MKAGDLVVSQSATIKPGCVLTISPSMQRILVVAVDHTTNRVRFTTATRWNRILVWIKVWIDRKLGATAFTPNQEKQNI